MQNGKRVICSEIGILIQIDSSAEKKKNPKNWIKLKTKEGSREAHGY